LLGGVLHVLPAISDESGPQRDARRRDYVF